MDKRLSQLYDATFKDGYTDGHYDAMTGHRPTQEQLFRRAQAYRDGYYQGRSDADTFAGIFTPDPQACGNSWGASW